MYECFIVRHHKLYDCIKKSGKSGLLEKFAIRFCPVDSNIRVFYDMASQVVRAPVFLASGAPMALVSGGVKGQSRPGLP